MKRDTAGRLLFFVRYPEAGRVKTRLGRDIGMERAAAIYRDMVESGCALLGTLERDGVAVEICFEPAERKKDMRAWLGGRVRLSPQEGQDLGERLRRAFRRAFDSGAPRVIVLGSDTLGWTPDLIRAAFRRLAEKDAVLGPSRDGGYYLLGLSRPADDVFRDIPWSTDRAAETTRARLREAAMTWTELEELNDLDDVASLPAWRGEEGR